MPWRALDGPLVAGLMVAGLVVGWMLVLAPSDRPSRSGVCRSRGGRDIMPGCWVRPAREDRAQRIRDAQRIPDARHVLHVPRHHVLHVPRHTERHTTTARLASQSEPADELAVAAHVPGAEVAQLPTPAPDELQEPAPGVEVMPVRTEVLRQVVDTLREQRDLHLGGASVPLMGCEVADDLLSAFGIDDRGDADWSFCCALAIADFPTHTRTGPPWTVR